MPAIPLFIIAMQYTRVFCSVQGFWSGVMGFFTFVFVALTFDEKN